MRMCAACPAVAPFYVLGLFCRLAQNPGSLNDAVCAVPVGTLYYSHHG